MIGITASAQVRTGKSPKAKLRAVCSASYWGHFRLHAEFTDHGFCIIDQVHTRFHFFFHIAVLLMERQLDGACSILFIEDFLDMTQHLLPGPEMPSVVIPDNILQLCMLHCPFHIRQMEKTLIAFRIPGCLRRRKHPVNLHGYQSRIKHLILGISWMDVKTADLKLGAAGIEIFIFYTILAASVYRISIRCSKCRNIQLRRAAAHFLIRSKRNAYFPMRDITLQQFLRHCHDFCHSRLVVCSQKRRAISGDQGSSLQIY